MNLNDDVVTLLKSVIAEWNRAENLIKTAELTCGSVIFPAIQELRYAGRRMVDAFGEFVDNPNSNAGMSFLQDAHFDCLRARHDAIDASMSKIASDIELSVNDLGADVVLTAFPKFSELVTKLDAVREKIEKSREDRTNRDGIYASIEADELGEIFPLYREFQASEEIMLRLADESQRKFKHAVRHRNYAYIIAAIGVLVGLISLI